MTGVNFKGRLGNQLFQFLFLRYLKSNGRKNLYFFPNPHHAYFAKYFDLGFWYNLTLNSKVYSILMRLIPRILHFDSAYFYNFSAPRPVKAEKMTIYNGYFQSDWYMLHTPGPIHLQLKKKYIKHFNEQFGEIFNQKKTICVHIRLTDYKNFYKRDLSLPTSYFKAQLEKIKDLDDYTVFFVSDDIRYIMQEFPQRSNFIFSSNDEITDFQIIQNADIAIISNSTFAWWAAYLSNKKNLVYAPKYWLGFQIGTEFPKGIMTDRFIWCDVI